MANYGYDKNVDYQQLINQDLEAGDYRSAGIHEQQRNEKIAGEGATEYQPTNHYAAYLPKTGQIDAGLDRLQNAKFEYSLNADPAYQAYRKRALREADRQTRDTMAAYSGQTLGTPSTAAVSAAQQAGNYERAKLNDAIPQLYEAAWDRWTEQKGIERQNIGLLADIEQQRESASIARQQWMDSRKRAEIEQAMQRWTTLGYADQSIADTLGVKVGTMTSDQSYRNWSMHMEEQQREDARQQQIYQNAMNRWTTLGYADQSIADALGVEVGAKTSDYSYQLWSQKLAERQQEQAEKQQNYQNAMNRWTTLGYADQSVADALGVKVGTTTSDQSYREWSMRLQEQQTEQDKLWREINRQDTLEQQQIENQRADRQLELQEQAQRYNQNTDLQAMDLQAGQQARSDAMTLVMALLQMGQTPNAALLQAAGLDTATAEQLRQGYLAQMTPGAAGGGGSSGGSGRRYQKGPDGDEPEKEQPAKNETAGKDTAWSDAGLRANMQNVPGDLLSGQTPNYQDVMRYGYSKQGELSSYGQKVIDGWPKQGNNQSPKQYLVQAYANVPDFVRNNDLEILYAKLGIDI